MHYEILDVRISEDGSRFFVEVVHPLCKKDVSGKIIPEIFQFPIAELDNEEGWKNMIERSIIKRLAHVEVKKELERRKGKKIEEIVEEVKRRAVGRVNVEEKVKMLAKAELDRLEKVKKAKEAMEKLKPQSLKK